jgi:single-stranded DNA-binding protein
MTEAAVNFAGNLNDQPRSATPTAASPERPSGWPVSGRREEAASFFTEVVSRDQAEHAAQSLAKGLRQWVVRGGRWGVQGPGMGSQA